MDIYLAAERAFHLIPQISLEVARDRLEQKKTSLVTGTLGALIARPKPEDIQIVSFENRLEAFWLINVVVHTVFERNQTYTIPVRGKEVDHVTALGQDLPVNVTNKGAVNFLLVGVEHCVEGRAKIVLPLTGLGRRLTSANTNHLPRRKFQTWENLHLQEFWSFRPKHMHPRLY